MSSTTSEPCHWTSTTVTRPSGSTPFTEAPLVNSSKCAMETATPPVPELSKQYLEARDYNIERDPKAVSRQHPEATGKSRPGAFDTIGRGGDTESFTARR